MKNILSLSTFLFLILYCASPENKRQEYEVVKRVDSFSGKSIRDSDITIHSHKEKGIISISGNRERFFFLLPYSEDWTVKYTDNSIIQLNSNSKNLIVSLTKESSETKVETEKFLIELKNRIESRIGVQLQNVRFTPESSNKILGYYIEANQNGSIVKTDDFWSIQQRPDNVILKLHFSTFNISEEDIRRMEKTLPIFMVSGFRVLNDDDFQSSMANMK
ncbi:MAG: hypothetical protein KBA66_22490 [Leptospiraceae bacterium]|nr:hypothetical protein [Leptospiraceae bacterium]